MASGNSSSHVKIFSTYLTQNATQRDAKRTKWRRSVKDGVDSQNSRRVINRTHVELRTTKAVHLNLKMSCVLTKQTVNVVSTSTLYIRRLSQNRAQWEWLSVQRILPKGK